MQQIEGIGNVNTGIMRWLERVEALEVKVRRLEEDIDRIIPVVVKTVTKVVDKHKGMVMSKEELEGAIERALQGAGLIDVPGRQNKRNFEQTSIVQDYDNAAKTVFKRRFEMNRVYEDDEYVVSAAGAALIVDEEEEQQMLRPIVKAPHIPPYQPVLHVSGLPETTNPSLVTKSSMTSSIPSPQVVRIQQTEPTATSTSTHMQTKIAGSQSSLTEFCDLMRDINTSNSKPTSQWPQEFEIPTKDSVALAWQKWCCGDIDRGVPPLRTLKSRDITDKNILRRLSDLRCIMQPIENLARAHNLWEDNTHMSLEHTAAILTQLAPYPPVSIITQENSKPRKKPLAWSTALNILRREKKHTTLEITPIVRV